MAEESFDFVQHPTEVTLFQVVRRTPSPEQGEGVYVEHARAFKAKEAAIEELKDYIIGVRERLYTVEIKAAEEIAELEATLQAADTLVTANGGTSIEARFISLTKQLLTGIWDAKLNNTRTKVEFRNGQVLTAQGVQIGTIDVPEFKRAVINFTAGPLSGKIVKLHFHPENTSVLFTDSGETITAVLRRV